MDIDTPSYTLGMVVGMFLVAILIIVLDIFHALPTRY